MKPPYRFLCLPALFVCVLLGGCPQKAEVPGALVLVNTASPGYADFQAYIVPYLETFGVPYTVLDLAVEDLTSEVESFSVILVAHRGLDPEGESLDAAEGDILAEAVRNGTGLVNFDNAGTTVSRNRTW